MSVSVESVVDLPDAVRTALLGSDAHDLQRNAEARAFFRGRLQDINEPCAPFGVIGDLREVSCASRACRSLDAELVRRAALQAEHRAVSFASVMHGAWALVVARTSACEVIVYGSATGQTSETAWSDGLGVHAEFLPLALHVSEATAESLVSEVHRELQELQRHERTSLAVAQSCSGVGAGAPLFTATFRYRSTAAAPVRAIAIAEGGEPDSRVEPASHAVQLDVAHEAEAIEVAALALQPIDADRVIGYFEAALLSLLHALEHAPQTPASSLAILPERERRELTEVFNDTRAGYRVDRLIHELFEVQAARTATAPALVHGTRAFTYAELDGRANQLATLLRGWGVGPDRLVGLYLERTPEMIIGVIAVLKAGGAYVPLDPNYPAERLQYMVTDAAPKVILTQATLLDRLPATSAKVVVVDVELQRAGSVPLGTAPARIGHSADQLVYVIYTSGSTGRPKGIAMPHRAVANLIEWHRSVFGDGTGVRALQFAALSFDVAFQEIFATLCTGGTLVLLDEWVRRDPGALLGLLNAESVNRLFVPPLMLQSLAEHCSATGAIPVALQDVIVAGEQLRVSAEIVELFRRLGARLHNHYGPTETHVVTALTLPSPAEAWPPLPTIGRPISNTRIYILDARYEPVPLGATGEIYIGGANVARGYLNRPELTAERFRSDPFEPGPDARMYKTGDLGRWRADGTIEYLGRNDDQVKIRGFRIELGEIEMLLARHEHVREVAVVARELDSGDKRLVAYLTARGTALPDAPTLRRFLRSALPEHMIPSAFVMLTRLPVTPSGKLDRRALPAPTFDQVGEQHEPPLGEIEEALATIWQEVLRVRTVGRLSHFFELGGDSLGAMRVLIKLAERFRVPLQAHVLLRDPTLRAMARSVEAQLTGGHRAAAEIPLQARSGIRTAPLTAMQRQWWTYINEEQQGLSERLCYTAMRIVGVLDCECLRSALGHAVARHAALRTRIVTVEGIPEQRVDPAAEYNFAVVELEHVPASDARRELLRLAEEFVTAKISLCAGTLFAARLFKASAQEHVLITAMEHAITDGSSLTILHQELWMLYRQAAEGQPFCLPEISLQFPDYALWQQQSGESWTREHEPYWRACLLGAPPITLPLKESATPDRRPAYSAQKIAFGLELSNGLRRLAQRERTLIALTMLTVYAAAMSRWCGQRDLTLVFVSNARVQPELQHVVGFLTNHLHLRVCVDDEDTCATLLARLSFELSAAYEHNDFDRVPLLFPECTTELYFNWQSAGWIPAAVELWPHTRRALRVEPFPLDVPWPRRFVPLFHETADGIVVTVHHRCDLVLPASVAQFGSVLIAVAEQFVANSGVRMAELRIA